MRHYIAMGLEAVADWLYSVAQWLSPTMEEPSYIYRVNDEGREV